MPEYLAPGVYVEEVDTGPKPIEGVSTSTVGFVGMTVRGPTSGPPKLVTSFPDFRRKFGGYLPATLGDNRFLAYAVRGFFENGGKRLYIKRVPGSGAATASDGGSSVGGLVTRLSKSATTGDGTVYLSTLRGIEEADTSGGSTTPRTQLTFKQVKDGVTTSETHGVKEYNAGTGAVSLIDPSTGSDSTLSNSYDYRYTAVATDITDPGTPVAISAADPGAWGDKVSVRVYHTSLAQAEVVSLSESDPVSSPGVYDAVKLNSTANFYAGAIIEFDLGETKVFSKVESVKGSSIVLNTGLGAATDLDHVDAPAKKTKASTCEFRIVASYDGVTEDYSTLTLDSNTSYYYYKVIEAASNIISVTDVDDNTTENPFTMPSAPDGLNVILSGGDDGSGPGDNAYIGVDNGPGQRTGIRALEDIDEISVIAVPGMVSQTVHDFMIIHCEKLKDRFAIFDPDYTSASALSDIQAQRKLYDTKYAAIYFPNLKIKDPVTKKRIVIPPSGHMAGIYARSDIERGVHKAPANEVIKGIVGLDLLINKAEQDILNPSPNNINVLRDFRARGRGYRVWGARCMTSASDWKYINVRRLFIFLEESLEEGTQWVVFEPNDEPAWARVRQSVTNFLTRVWRDGALMGSTAEEAFFVKCDRTTMTQDDIDNGRLIMIIGVAPVKPAEYVIIRIGQWDGGSETEEL